MSYKDYLKEQYNYLKTEKKNFIFKDDIINKDEKVYSKGRKLNKEEWDKIHTNLRPQPLAGDITNGKIFICVLNPGFDDKDYITEEDKKVQNELMKQLEQNDASFFWLRKEFEEKGGGQYWRNKLDQESPKGTSLVDNLQQLFNVDDKEIIFDMLSKVMVDIELFPYHSKNAGKIRGQIEKTINDKLPKYKSVKEVYNFVHKELLPNATSNNQLVCFVRALKLWNVNEKQSTSNVKYIDIGRGRPYFNVNKELGKSVFEYIKKNKNYFEEKIEEVKNDRRHL